MTDSTSGYPKHPDAADHAGSGLYAWFDGRDFNQPLHSPLAADWQLLKKITEQFTKGYQLNAIRT